MKKKFLSPTFNKSSVGFLIIALVVGGISAQAAGLLNTKSGGYLVCVNSATKAITHPGKSTCPKGSKKLILGAQGVAGTNGVSGATGIAGKDGTNGKDGKTLWSGVKDPESTLGAPGDMFINSLTKTLFGPKDLATSWPAGVSMVGPAGAPGPGGPGGGSGPSGPAGSNATLTCAQGGTCVVGNIGPGGGIVFYVQTATATAPWRYLEAAPNTWSGSNEDTAIIWCSNINDFVPNLLTGETATVTTATAIGTGYANTQKMLRGCAYGAANAAASYNGGGKSNWHLPSRDELNQMCKWARGQAWTSNDTQCDGTGTLNTGSGPAAGFVAYYYWSSSEFVANRAWFQAFNLGARSTNLKNATYYVRPVRAF
jgi:Protein of unknown function (DUF1566)